MSLFSSKCRWRSVLGWMLVVLLVGSLQQPSVAAAPNSQALEFDYTQDQSPPRPTPGWVQLVDLGERNPELKGYLAPAGVRVEIVAREPQIVNPVGMRFAEDGTLYILEWKKANRSQAIKTNFVRKEGTAVSVDRMWKDSPDVLKELRDTDGDGRYETSRVVFGDLEMPSSVLFQGGWAYFGSIGHVIRRPFPPTPNSPATSEELLRGFCGYHHHQVSGLSLGHDGWMYVTAGDNDNRVEARDGSFVDVLRTGVVTRSTLNGEQVSEFARGFRNPYRDVVFDENFNMFHVDNDQEDGSKFQGVRLLHVVEGGDYGWRLLPNVICCRTDFDRCAVSGELPGKLPAMLKTGRGAPAGLLHYTSRGMPQFFHGINVYPDVYRKLVRGYRFEKYGATFRVAEEFPLLQSTDDYFRPVQALAGPDGAIYVLDWRTNSGGAGKLWGDAVHGRLYRLSWEGTPSQPAIPLESLQSWSSIAKLSDAALLELLRSGDFERRQRAQSVLQSRGDRVRQSLLQILRNSSEPRLARIHALGAIQAFWNLEVEQTLVQTLADPDADLRRLAADGLGNRLRQPDRQPKWGTSFSNPASETILELTRRLAAESELSVKRQLALALAKIDGGEQGSRLAQLAFESIPQEVFYRDGVIRAWELCGKSALSSLLSWIQSDNATTREVAVDLLEATRSSAAFSVLQQAIDNSQRLTAQQRGRLFLSYRNYQFLNAISPEPIIRWLAAHPEAEVPDRLGALKGISLAGGSTSSQFQAMLLKWLDSPSKELRREVIAQIRLAGLQSAGEPLAQRLVHAATPAEEQQEILKALAELRASGAASTLRQLSRTNGALQGEALQTLFAVDVKAAQEMARELVSETQEQALLTTAVNILGTSPEGALFIGKQFVGGKLPRSLLPVVSDSLRKHTARDPALSDLLRDVMKGGLLLSLDPTQVKKMEEQIRVTGNPARGLRIFMDQTKVRCIGCHRLEGIGGQIGPDLSRIWETHSVTKIMESMIEPSKEVKEGFQTYILETQAGLVHVGLKIQETADSVTIRDAQGKDFRVLKSEIEELKADPKSVMPDDVAALLTYQDFVDLVSFLKDRQTQDALRSGFHWWVIGTFPRRIYEVFPPEQNPNPQQIITGVDGLQHTWLPAHQEGDGRLDLRAVLDAEDIMAYAMTYVYSPKSQTVELRTGSDDALRVWLNDKLVVDYPDNRLAVRDQDRVEVTLKSGWNVILAKVTNNKAKHELFLRFLGGEGLRFSRDPQPTTVTGR